MSVASFLLVMAQQLEEPLVFAFTAGIAGNVTPDQDSTRDLGTNTERWANAYVDDIQ